MSAKVYVLADRREPPSGRPPVPPDRRDAVFYCLVCLAGLERYEDPDRFLDMLWKQGFMVVRAADYVPVHE